MAMVRESELESELGQISGTVTKSSQPYAEAELQQELMR